jgi:hypothetical protein
VVAGVKQLADIHVSQELLAAADIAVAVLVAVVLQAVAALVAAAQELLHSPTLRVAVVVVVATVQTSAGTVTQDILVATVAVDLLDHITVQHTEQVAAVELVY